MTSDRILMNPRASGLTKIKGKKANNSIIDMLTFNPDLPVANTNGNQLPSVQDIQNASADKASYDFRSTITSRIEVADNVNINVGTGDFTHIATFRTTKDTGVQQIIFDKAPSGTVKRFAYVEPITGKIKVGVGGVSTFINQNVIDSQWKTLAVKRENSVCSAFLNGVDQGITLTSADDLSTNTAPLRIGAYSTSLNLAGQISRYLQFNYALSPEKIAAYSQGRKLDYEDVGGKQGYYTVANKTFDTDLTGWLINAGTVTRDTVTKRSGAGSCKIVGALYSGIFQGAGLVTGKNYKFSFYVYGTAGTVVGASVAGSSNYTIAVSNAWELATITFRATSINFDIVNMSAISTTIYIDDISDVDQLGAIVDLEPENITDTMWVDASPNGIHGAVIGAVSNRFVPQYSSRNYIINGGMDFWQRAVAGTTPGAVEGGYVSVDRWKGIGHNAGVDFSFLQLVQSTDTPSGASPYSLKLTGLAGLDDAGIMHVIESATARRLVGKKCTLSFKMKRLSLTSPKTVSYSMAYCTSQDVAPSQFHSLAVVGTSFTQVTTLADSISTEWVTYSLTFNVPAAAGNGLLFILTVNGNNINAIDILAIAEVQLNEGPVAAPFERAGGNIGGELVLCQRYYRTCGVELPARSEAAGTTYTVILPITSGGMRIPPSVSGQGALYWHTSASVEVLLGTPSWPLTSISGANGDYTFSYTSAVNSGAYRYAGIQCGTSLLRLNSEI